MHLIGDAWLPGRDGSGLRIVRPAEMTASINHDPLLSIDWPRPDFRFAALEFLIGLLALACPPRDEEAWFEWWNEPPIPERLDAAWAPYAHAFSLDGDGPRFMQDLEDLPGAPNPPETLLIEAPGEATRRDNTALLNKPDRVRVLSRSAAAMALFTLQTYAPAGGRGNLTSVRGGGPLTTLVLPGRERSDRPTTLWHMLWANVPCGKPVPPGELARALPWLAPTRTADRFPATTPADSHPLQAFWGMPRRIRLDFAPNTAGVPCDLTGIVDDVIVTGWRQRPNGVKYVAFTHPLSPYYKDAKAGWLPVHPQPGDIGYRHWLGLAFTNERAMAAKCITDWRTRAHPRDVGASVREGTRLLAGGYDMDNMKARSFVESEMPLPGAGDRDIERQMELLARGLVGASEIVARALRLSIRDAVLGRDAALDSAPLATAYEALWTTTQEPFFDALRRAVEAPPDDDPEAALKREAVSWRDRLRRVALLLFDDTAPLDPSAASFDYERIVTARRNLMFTLKGYGAFGNQLCKALALPVPEAKPKRRQHKGAPDEQ
jgi:CRISPR system Cascade subunit CasA